MKNLILRKDLLGNPAIFDADTQKESGIMMWNGVHGAHMKEVPEAYYRTTVAMDNQEEKDTLLKGWTSNFGDRELNVRQRLIKNITKPAAAQDAQTTVGGLTAQQKTNLLKAFTAAMEKALEAV